MSDLKDDPRAQEFNTRHQAAGTALEEGRWDDAIADYDRCRELVAAILVDHPDRDDLRDLHASTHYNAGNTHHYAGRPGPARDEFRAGLALQEQLCHDHPDVPQYHDHRGRSLFNLGNASMDLDQHADAVDYFGRAGDVWDHLLGLDATRADLGHERARSYFNRGYALTVLNRFDEAITDYQRALERLDTLIVGEASLPVLYDFGRGAFNLSQLLSQANRPLEALDAVQRSLPRFTALIQLAPQEPRFVGDLLRSAERAEQLAVGTGDADRVLVAFRAANAARIATNHPEALNAAGMSGLNAAGWFRDTAERPFEMAEAYELSASAFAALSRRDGPRPRLMEGVVRFDFGLDLRSAGRTDAAEEQFRRSALVLGPLSADFPDEPNYRHHLAGAHNNLGILYADCGRLARAEAEYRFSQSVRESVVESHPDIWDNRLFLGGTLCNLGNVALDRHDVPTARDFYDRSLSVLGEVQRSGKLAGQFANLLRSFQTNASNGRANCEREPTPPLEVQSATVGYRQAGPPIPDEFALSGIEDEPDSRNGRLGRGHTQRLFGNSTEALNDADAVLKEDPEDADAWFLRGLVLGRFLDEEGGEAERYSHEINDLAVLAFDEAILLRRDWYEARYYKGRTLIAAAHAASARLNVLGQVIAERNPTNEVREVWLRPARLAFGYAFWRAHDVFDGLTRFRPEDARGWAGLADLLEELGGPQHQETARLARQRQAEAE